MLQNIRKNSQGIIAKVIVVLIVGSFATFGVQSILIGSGNDDVAEIDGAGISSGELQQAINIQKRRLLSALGDRINPDMLDDKMLRGPAMESLIQQKIYLNAAEQAGIATGNEALKREIAQMPQFMQDGTFSVDLYQNLLANNGYSPALFHKLLQEERTVQQLRSGLASTEFLTREELKATAQISQETRDIRYLTVTVDSFRKTLEPSSEEIEGYYNDHLNQFMTAESLLVEYLELKTSDLYPEVTDEAIKTEYDLRMADTVSGVERRASHILLEIGSASDVETLDKIKLIQQKLSLGESFADLASEYSDDKSSASNGGDLGFSSGDIFPEPLETQLENMELMAVSKPVKTEAGWHLLQLTAINQMQTATLAELRAEILESLQSQAAKLEIVSQVETLKDSVFNAEGLDEPGAELGLQVSTSIPLFRTGNSGLFANASLTRAAFSDDVLGEGHNSDVIELSADHYVVLRVKEYSASRAKPLGLVEDKIVKQLTEEAAQSAAREQAVELVVTLRSGSSVETEALSHGYNWQVELGVLRGAKVLPTPAMSKVFSLQKPAEGASSFDYVALANGDILVFELDRVTRGDITNLSASRVKQILVNMGNERSQTSDRLYQKALRNRADISVL